PPRHWRLPSAHELAAFYDPVPGTFRDEPVLAAIGVRADLTVDDTESAIDLLDRLADPNRNPAPELIVAAHAALADAVESERIDPGDVPPPERVRALDGSVVAAEDAVVLDALWA